MYEDKRKQNNQEIVRMEASRLIGLRARPRITRGRGIVRRIGIIANQPRRRTMQLTRLAGSAGRITWENVNKGHRHVIKHANHLRMVLRTLVEHRMYAKFSKCEFWLPSVQFLGHVITKDGLSVDPAKVEAVSR
ncbi:hypothetical protein UlMin_027700 [Ulmus minor]